MGIQQGYNQDKCDGYNENWLVVWNMNFMTFHILGMSSSQLTNSMIFQRGRAQPPTREHV